MSERQAQAILNMRLQKLTGLERDKILEELAEIQIKIERLRAILADEGKLLGGDQRASSSEVRETYADERRTEIRHDTSELSIEDLIAEEQMVVTLSHAGYIKRTPLNEYQAQRRGGRGKRGMATRDEDFVEDMFIASTHSHILFFSSIGKVYKLKVHELPLGSRTTRGKAVVNLLPLEPDEAIKAVLPIDEFNEGRYILTATRRGVVKKTDLMAYSRVLSVGIIALSLKEGDELVDVKTTSGKDYVFLASRSGQGIVFSEKDVRPMGRTAAGVYGMRFKEDDDELVSMTVVPAAQVEGPPEGAEEEQAAEGAEEQAAELESARILTVTERGYGKRTELDEHPVQGRGGKGVITIKPPSATACSSGAGWCATRTS